MYNKDSNSLNAGAPDIRLSGNQDPNQQMAMSDESNTQLLESLYEEFLGMGFSPKDAARKAQEAFDQMSQAPQQNLGIMAAAPGTYTQQRKQMMAYGGIAGADGRKAYGIGSWLQEKKDKIVDDLIPNELKENPLLTAALVGGGINQFGLPDFLTGGTDVGQNWLGDLLGTVVPGETQFNTVFGDTLPFMFQDTTTNPLPGGLDQLYKDVMAKDLIGYFPGQVDPKLAEAAGLGTDKILSSDLFKNVLSGTGEGATGTLGAYLKNQAANALKQKTGLDTMRGLTKTMLGDTTRADGTTFNWKIPVAAGLAAGAYTASQPRDTLPMDTTGINFQTAQQAMDDPNLRFKPKLEDTQLAAEGGRIGAQEGGLMNLGGMEKDYRQEGGFVPIGGKEKADDVPARLSKNEFVFTADAVRAAGGGDIDEGAAVMERLMENLEAGGKVSEDSQGLEGARSMFANAQQLEKRII